MPVAYATETAASQVVTVLRGLADWLEPVSGGAGFTS
jgi:hypothetical protein